MSIEAPPQPPVSAPPPPEKWALWQHAVVGVLALAVLASGARLAWRNAHPTQTAAPTSQLPLGFLPLTPDQEIAAYQRQLGATGTNPLALDKLALAYVRKARATSDPSWYLLAEQAARRSISQDSRDADAQLVLARVLLARHDFKGALTPIKATEAILGPGPETGGLRFDVHMALGDLPAARLDLNGLGAFGVSLARHGLYLDAVGEDARSQEALLDSIKILGTGDPETVAWSHVNLANAQLRQGNHPAAKAHFAQALATLPGYVPALIGQAELARRENRWGDIITAIELLVKEGTRADLLLRLTEAGRLSGRREDAARWYAAAGQALEQERTAGGFWHRRDRVRWLLDEPHDAGVAEASRAITAELALRHDLETQLIAGEVAVRAGDKARALTLLGAVVATGVHDARVWYWLSRATAEPAAAAAWLAKAHARDPLFDQPALEAKAADQRANP